jgi:hypothetical protein
MRLTFERESRPMAGMNTRKLAACMLVLGSLIGESLWAQNAFNMLWSVAPGAQPWMTTGNTERGIAYNPASGNVLVVSRAITGTEIEILNGLTGAKVGTLSLGSGVVSGGTFNLNLIDVADDGAIYAANLTTASGGATTPLKIYRWASESATPTLIYAGDPTGANQRFGDTFAVRGAGNNTQILLSARSTNSAALFTTANGFFWNSTKLTISGQSSASGAGLGLAFGSSNSFYGRTTSSPLNLIGYDTLTGNATVLTTNTLNGLSGTVAPIGVSLSLNRLVGIEISASAGVVQRADLFDLSAMTGNTTNSPLDSFAFPTANANANGTGAVDWDSVRGIVYVLDSNNGLMALAIPEPSSAGAILLGLGLLGMARRQRG